MYYFAFYLNSTMLHFVLKKCAVLVETPFPIPIFTCSHLEMTIIILQNFTYQPILPSDTGKRTKNPFNSQKLPKNVQKSPKNGANRAKTHPLFPATLRPPSKTSRAVLAALTMALLVFSGGFGNIFLLFIT